MRIARTTNVATRAIDAGATFPADCARGTHRAAAIDIALVTVLAVIGALIADADQLQGIASLRGAIVTE